MADNVTLNVGTGGDVIASEDIGGVEYQRVKLVDGTAASTTTIPLSGDLTNGLDVDVTRVSGTVTVDGSGVTQPVSGTVTANLSATDNAVLDSIDTAVNGTLTVSGTVTANAGTGTMTVDLGTDNDITIEGGAVLGTTGSAGPANAISIGGTESGGTFREVAVDSSGNLQVDIVSGSSSGTEYTEDDVVPANPAGPTMLAERDDALSTLTPAAGDWTHLRTDSTGALWVNAVNAGGTSNVDTAAGGTDEGAVMLAVRDDTLTTLTPADGDYVNLRVNSTGALHVTGAGGGTQYTIDDAGPTVVTLAGTIRDDTLTTLTEADGDASTLRVNSQGALHVTGGGGGTEYNEDAATPATITGTATMMERDDALGTLTPAEGDWASFRCSAEGALWVQDFNSDAILADTANMDTNLGTLAGAVSGSEMQVDIVSGTVTANLSATDNAVLDNIDTNTSKGASHYRNVDANAEAAIKGSAGTLHWIHAMNMTAAVAYLHLYDATTASVTPGTTTPDYTFPIPTQGDTNGAGFNLRIEQDFANAITLVVTTTIDGSAGDPGTNGVFINAGYT